MLLEPGFGRVFTDHMVTLRWTRSEGWHDGRVGPRARLEVDPAAMGIHYGQAIFEGLKAYRQPDGTVAVFRPLENARRLNASALRLAMPRLPERLFLRALQALLLQDEPWVPAGIGRSLYLRPVMFATEAQLGLRAADEYMFCVIASPSAPQFSSATSAISLWLENESVRAVPGGTGAAKCAGNYGATLVAQQGAAERGCDAVLWTRVDGHTRYVEELGNMNAFLVRADGKNRCVVTPPLEGTILAGVVRSSVLELARASGYAVEERPIAIDELTGAGPNRVEEMFGCGTAAVIVPVGAIVTADARYSLDIGGEYPVATQLRETLLNIQHGREPDRFGWMVPAERLDEQG